MPTLIDRVLPIPNSSYEIGLEHLPGAVRHWGKRYAKKLAIGYGHIRNTFNPSDGKALDCYVHPDLIEGSGDSARIFQIDQLNQDGDFDEPKLMIGFGSASEAEAAYLREMPRSFFGGIAEIGEEAIEAYRKEKAIEFKAASSSKKPIKQKNCTKGYSCGGSCIQKSKACKGNQLSGQAAATTEFLSKAIAVVNPSIGGQRESDKTFRQIADDLAKDPKTRKFITLLTQSRKSDKKVLEELGLSRDEGLKLVSSIQQQLKVRPDQKLKDRLVEIYKDDIKFVESWREIEPCQKEDAIEFAAKSKPKKAIAGKPQRKCTKGYSCGYSCIQKTKSCAGNRLSGQAATYATFLSNAIKTGRSLSATHQADAAAAGLLNKASKPAKATTKTKPAVPAAPPRQKLTIAQIQQDQQQSKSSASAKPATAIKINQANLDKTRADLVDRFGEKLVSDAEANTQKLLKDSDVFIRVGSNDTLEKILGNRFATAHELNKTEHEVPYLKDNYLDARARVEAKTLGYDEKGASPADRPIYGYFGGDDLNGESHADAGRAYGSIAVKLKPEAKTRVTFTGCDSFKSGVASELSPDGTPPPPNAASLVSVTRHGYDNDSLPSDYPSHYKAYSSKAMLKSQLSAAAKAKSIDDLAPALAPTGAAYVEAQIHGQVKPQDLAEVHYTPSGTERPSPKVAQFCKDNGVALFVGGKKVDPDDILNPPKPANATNDAQRISDAIEAGDVGAMVQATEALHRKADQVQMALGEPAEAHLLKALIQSAGFDAKPKVGTEAELDAEVAKNATMMVRGVMPPPSGDKLAYLKQFQSGDYHIGTGMYGHGTYVGHSGEVRKGAFIPGSSPAGSKNAVNRVEKHKYINSKTVNFRMALAQDAVVVTQSALEKEQAGALNSLGGWEKAEIAKVKAAATPQKSDALQAIDRSVDDALKSTKITKVDAFDAGFNDAGGNPLQNLAISYQSPDGKTKTASSLYVKLPSGAHQTIDPNTGKPIEFDGLDALQAHVLKTAIQDDEAKKANFRNYDAINTVGTTFDSATIQKIQQIKDQHDRAGQVLGDLSHFAVIKGYDAVALDGSYEPDAFMNVLNRGKVMIQDTPLSLKTAKQKGLS